MKSARKSVRRDHAGETRNPTNKEKTELLRILNKIIKIILLGPTSTPPEALHIETGTMDIEHTTMKNRLNRDKTLQANPNSLTSKVKEMEQSKKKYNTYWIENKKNGNQDGIHECVDEKTGQHNLQSMNKNAECEKQLQVQPPKHWMQNVQERNGNTKTHSRRMPINPLGKHTKNNRR